MLDPAGLYDLRPDLPALDRPVLIQAMDGFVDAGGAVRLSREQLRAHGEPQTLARFDHDQLLDYRSRRPAMLFVEDHWDTYDEPDLTLDLLRDAEGTPFLCLAGPEPDIQWERFLAAVGDLIDRLGVRLTIGLNAIPMAVPHTRPAGVTAHATSPNLVAGYRPWVHTVQVPASAGNLLEYRLGQAGKEAIGFAVHVPHYVAQVDYPAAAAALLEAAAAAGGLVLPTADLRAAATGVRADVDQQVAQSTEVSGVVHQLEEQYDALVASRGRLAEASANLPTADELGAELERFLAEQGRRREQDG